MASTANKTNKNVSTKKSINIIRSHVQNKTLKGNKSNNSSFKKNQGFKNVVKQTTKPNGNLAEKVCGILSDGIKHNKNEENKEADSLENPDDDGNDFDIDLENINLDDPLGFTKSEKAEVKDEKKEETDSKDKFIETAMAKIRVERLIKLRFLRRAKDEGDSKKEEPKDPPFRNFASTGKYLHETDKRWCLKHTKLSSEKDILKWLKRFRQLCPRGQMGLEQLQIVYNKIFAPGGNPEFFCGEVMARFDIEEKNALDFKVFLFLVQISLFNSNSEKLHWVVQLLDLDDTGMVNLSEIENCALMFEELERRVRPTNLFELDADPEFDPAPTFEGLRHKPIEERMILMRNHLELPEDATFLSREALFNMPIRHISSFWEDIEDFS